MDFIFDMLNEAKKNSTDINNNEDSSNIVFERDKRGNLIGYDKETGKKVGEVYEHGSDSNVAKSFSEIIRRE